jgi:hypothetical protein
MQAVNMNSWEVLAVIDNLQKQGIKDYTIQPGNECIWVSYGQVNCYYLFNESKLIDIQFD